MNVIFIYFENVWNFSTLTIFSIWKQTELHFLNNIKWSTSHIPVWSREFIVVGGIYSWKLEGICKWIKHIFLNKKDSNIIYLFQVSIYWHIVSLIFNFWSEEKTLWNSRKKYLQDDKNNEEEKVRYKICSES